MRVSIVGGTGDFGEGLAVRFGVHTDSDIVIGSRDADKARAKAEQYRERVEGVGADTSISGARNEIAVRQGEVVIITVPPYYVRDTIDAVERELAESEPILVTPAVGISTTDDGAHYDPPGTGSVTELVAAEAPAEVPVVGALHSLPAERLADPTAELGLDALLVGDDPNAKRIVADLISRIDGLSPVDAGPLSNAAVVESLTPLLITISQWNDDIHDVGVSFR